MSSKRDSRKRSLTILYCLVGVVLLLAIARFIFVSYTHVPLVPAIKLYVYDGSSPFCKLKDQKIDNEDYSIAEQYWAFGDYQNAIGHYQAALDALTESFGETDLRIAFVHMKIGTCCYAMKYFDSAYEHLLSAYTTYKLMMGSENEATSEIKAKVAFTRINLGDYESAIRDLEECYKNIRYYVSRVEICWGLGNALLISGRPEEAVQWLEKSQGYLECVNRKRWGDGYYRTISEIEFLLGRAYLNMKDYSSAERTLRAALEDVLIEEERSPGSQNHNQKLLTQVCLNLSTMYYNQCAFEESLKYLELAEGSVALSGTEDLDTLFYLSKIKVQKALLEGFVEVEETQSEYLERMATEGSPEEYSWTYEDDPYIVAYRMPLGDEYQAKASHETESFLLEALEKMIEASGEHSVITSNQLLLIAGYYYTSLDNEKALEYCRRAIEDQRDVLNPEGNMSMVIYQQAFWILLDLGRYEEAAQCIIRAIGNCCAVYGYRSHNCLELLYYLGMALEHIDRIEARLVVSELGLRICDEAGVDREKYSFSLHWSKAAAAANEEALLSASIAKADSILTSADNDSFAREIAALLDLPLQ